MLEKVPVTILAGYLGSGKTTLLNRMLTQAPARTAVVENEVGAVDIDGELIVRTEGDIVTLRSGCLCCSVRTDLIDALAQLERKQSQIDAVIVENSGLAAPGPVIQTILADPAARRWLTLKGVVTLVDTANVGWHLDHGTPEVTAQITFADALVVNKTDLVGPERIVEIEERLRSLNSSAVMHRSSFADVSLDDLTSQDRDSGALGAIDQTGSPHVHDAEVQTVTIELLGDLSGPKVYRLIGDLLAERGRTMLRMKGILSIAGVSDKMILQAVHSVGEGIQGGRWDGEARKSRIVCIGHHLNETELKTEFASCLVVARRAD